MVDIIQNRGDIARANAICKKMINLAPDSETGAAACDFIVRPLLFPGDAGKVSLQTFSTARQYLTQMVVRYPNTKAEFAARYNIGQLYLAQGMPEIAERDWFKLLNEQGDAMDADLKETVRVELAHLRFNLALAANSAGNRIGSVRYMARVLKEPGWDQLRTEPLALYALWCEDLGQNVSPDWFREMLWAYRELMALASSKDEKLSYQMEAAVALQGLGEHAEAAKELRAVLANSPTDSELLAQCNAALKLSEQALKIMRRQSNSAPVRFDSSKTDTKPNH